MIAFAFELCLVYKRWSSPINDMQVLYLLFLVIKGLVIHSSAVWQISAFEVDACVGRFLVR